MLLWNRSHSEQSTQQGSAPQSQDTAAEVRSQLLWPAGKVQASEETQWSQRWLPYFAKEAKPMVSRGMKGFSWPPLSSLLVLEGLSLSKENQIRKTSLHQWLSLSKYFPLTLQILSTEQWCSFDYLSPNPLPAVSSLSCLLSFSQNHCCKKNHS